jgi:hypothetical protein
VSETELQKAVIELARRLGWRTAHFRPGLTKAGNWVTAVQGDGAGFPDLFMVKPGSSLAPYAIELKSERGRVSEEQQKWLDALSEAGCYAAVWRPKDWLSGRIEQELRLGAEVAA